MSNYNIDPHLKRAIEQGHIQRITFDFENKTIILWHSDANLAEEFERAYSRALNANTSSQLLKKDYAFDVSWLLAFAGSFVTENTPAGLVCKTVLHYDLAQRPIISDTNEDARIYRCL